VPESTSNQDLAIGRGSGGGGSSVVSFGVECGGGEASPRMKGLIVILIRVTRVLNYPRERRGEKSGKVFK